MGRLLARFIGFVFSMVLNNTKDHSEGNDNMFYIMVFRETFSGYSAAQPRPALAFSSCPPCIVNKTANHLGSLG